MAHTIIFFVLALAASATARPSNTSSEEGQPNGNIDLNSPLMLDDMRFVEGQLEQVKDAGLSFEQFRWPGAIVPYEIDRKLAQHINLFALAFAQFSTRTCINFVPRNNQHRNYIYIFKGEGCYSNVGMINQGRQPVSIGRGCETLGTIVHELAHAVGFFHEQNRDDRDDYLIINWANIQRGMEDQFAKVSPENISRIDPFDYKSIMLYGNTAFSKDKRSPTMVAKNGVPLRTVAEKGELSDSDCNGLNNMYNCRSS